MTNYKDYIDFDKIDKQWQSLPKETRDAEIALFNKTDERDKFEILRIRKEYKPYGLGSTTAEFLAIYARYIHAEEVKAKNKLSPSGNHILDR